MAEAKPQNLESGTDSSDFSDEELSPEDLSFNQAADHVKGITGKLDNNQLLELYGLYKQSTEGSCTLNRPGLLDMKGRKKWYAWKALANMPKVEAKKKYTSLVSKIDPTWTIIKKPSETWISVSSHLPEEEPELNIEELTLLEAAREDCVERIEQLLSLNPTLKNVSDPEGLTAVHWAADRDATKALLAVLKAGCPVDAPDGTGQTPLHYASACGHVNAVKILLEHGASPLCQDEEGSTPIDSAVDDDMKNLLQSAIKK